ncbi:iron complex outermembrane recepter protein [Pseudovibrio ascidiaceicola]|uniref:Iron complex outermembrane recepter protein n=1 Tax=Pseudovibrio ascidiaceicola TaxID=285279 RepID=A0A1I4CNE5_9HYPH|nr:TonB-dependent siderophore receptor [Pseudovibrio ascidiaceicola]SFK81769.1 iron complex outermembrane recepter protein [Pseudovibrio ascidiaceicola]
MGIHYKSALLSGSSISLLLFAGIANAQEAGPPNQDLDEVVVYGSSVAEDALAPTLGYVPTETASAGRIGLPIEETPRSVSVVSSQQMEDQGAESIVDAISYSAGVMPAIYGFDLRYDNYTIRGFESGVGGVNYRDGLPLRIFAWGGWNIEPFGVERVEVLRGPSSDLIGANQPGGLVNTVTKRPLEDFEAKIQASYGNHNRKQIAADVTGSLSEASPISYRLVGVGRLSDTQVDEVKDDRLYFAPSLTAKIGDNTKLTLLAQYQKDIQGASWQILPSMGTLKSNGQEGDFDYSTFAGDPDRKGLNRDQHYIGYELDHDFGDGVELYHRARLAYNKINYDSAYNGGALDFDSLTSSPTAISGIDTAVLIANEVDETAWQGSVDTALKWDKEFGAVSTQFVAGVDLYKGQSEADLGGGYAGEKNLKTGDITSNLGNLLKAGGTTGNPVADNAFYAYVDGLLAPQTGYQDQKVSQAGVYAAANSKIFDKFRLDLSLRHDWLSTETRAKLASPGAMAAHESTYNTALTGRIGASYVSDIGFIPFVSYGTSFDVPPAGVTTDGKVFDPTTAEQFEVGLKYAPEAFNGFFSVTGFHITKDNLVVSDPDNSAHRAQVGEVRSQGIEVEGAIELFNGLSALASYTYLDTEITKDLTGKLAGKQLERTPEHSGSFWLKYDFADQGNWLDGLSIAAGARYLGDRYADTKNTVQLDAVTLLDAGVTYEYNNLKLSFTGRNLADKSYISHCGTASLADPSLGLSIPTMDSMNCTYGRGRELRLQLTSTF